MCVTLVPYLQETGTESHRQKRTSKTYWGVMLMRRERRQTGSTRVAKQTKMDSLQPQVAVHPGPYPWDRYIQAIPKPSGRVLRRSFGAKSLNRQS